jgi:uncharacterized protein YlxW (UPF0749 family)
VNLADRAPQRPSEAAIPLLTQVMTRPLDPGYAAAAARRAGSGQPPGRGGRARSSLALAALLAVGLLLGTAWWQAHRSIPTGTTSRRQLIAEIARQDATAGRLQSRNADLLAAVDAERARQLQLQAQGGLADQVADLGLATGTLAATGPGLVVTLDDAPSARNLQDDSDPRSAEPSEDGRVLDQDLQLVVNGLWFAGAEAISVNGQRLTAMSAIRSAGQAILVDYRPLSPPYQVSAIGDPARLRSRFDAGPGGQDVQYLKDNFGVRVTIGSSSGLRLPASAGLGTRRARPAVTTRPGGPVSPASPATGGATRSTATTTTEEAP